MTVYLPISSTVIFYNIKKQLLLISKIWKRLGDTGSVIHIFRSIYLQRWFMVFNTTLNNISVILVVVSFYWWRKPEYPVKTTNLTQPMTNFITYCCIQYILLEWDSNTITLSPISCRFCMSSYLLYLVDLLNVGDLSLLHRSRTQSCSNIST
jgi:hypothetical protein